MRKKTMWITGAGLAAALVLGGTGVALAVAEPWETDDDGTLQPSSTLVDRGDDVMGQSTYSGTGSSTDSSTDSSTGSGTDSNTDSPSDDLSPEPPISDADRDAASEAALAEIGSGTVTDVDRDDGPDHVWEVEVTLPDGTDADVELDESFAVTRVDRD
jgi:uncharacterized membrane protein YkoI